MSESALAADFPGLRLVAGRDGTIRSADTTWDTVLDPPGEELRKVNLSDLALPEDREAVAQAIRRAASEGEATVTARFEGSDGPVWLDCRIRRAEDGDLHVAAWDVTDHRSVESTLSKRADRLESLIDRLDVGVFQVDLAGNITYLNDAVRRLTGYDPDEMEGTRYVDHFDEEGVQTLFRSFNNVYRTGVALDGIEVRFERADGEEAAMELSVDLMRGTSGEPIGFAGTFELVDGDPPAPVETAPEPDDRGWADVSFAASHDLQEPLRSLVSHAQLLERRYGDRLGPEADETLTFLVEQATKLRTRVRALAQYAELGASDPPTEPVDLDEALEQATDSLSYAIEGTDTELRRDDLPTVEAHPKDVVRVLEHLIENAIKFHRDAPTIRVDAEQEDGRWIVAVRDDGPGIDPEHHGRVFDLYERLDPAGSAPGAGVGLAMCKRMVERNGGEIWIEDTDVGTTVRFSLDAA